MALIKTPLRYPGGKSRMVKYLDQFVPSPDSWDEYREPFVGGASMFLWMRQKYPDKKFWINDKYYNLYCFWISLRDDCEKVTKLIMLLKNQFPDKESGKELFGFSSSILKDSRLFPKVDVAAHFYIVNKTSFSGLTEDSHYAPMAYDQNFGWRTIQKFPEISALLQGVKITCLDYSELLSDNPRVFVYLDPPYDIKYSLYGGNGGSLHKGFDHVLLSNRLRALRNPQWILSYNDNDQIRYLYTGFPIDNGFHGSYTMNCPRGDNGDKKSKGNSEIVIWSHRDNLVTLGEDEIVELDRQKEVV